VLSVLPNQAEAANDIVFLAPNQRYYRIILVMHQVYGNGQRDFIINMIETLQRNWGGDHRTTILTAGIMLASKYRSLFLEKDSRYQAEALSVLSDDELRLKVGQLLRDLGRIYADGAAEGLADQNALIKLLGATDEVKDLFDKWWPPINAMEKAAQQFFENSGFNTREEFMRTHAEFIKVSEITNRRFIGLCLKAYQAIIDQRQFANAPA
jgi:hypothetical protein